MALAGRTSGLWWCLLHNTLLEHIVWDWRNCYHFARWHDEAFPWLLGAAAEVIAAELLCMSRQTRKPCWELDWTALAQRVQ